MYLTQMLFKKKKKKIRVYLKGGTYMLNKVKTNMFQLFGIMLTFLTIYTVNSCCMLILGQDKEPESLQRFKN